MVENNGVDNDDVIRIMVATDNHLGFNEKDAIRGNDSFNAFEEILQLAVSLSVDLILLGGDLFHDAVPSQNSMHRCMQLLRRYTFGDKPIALEFLSDQSMSIHSTVNQTVNYEDPNLNVSIPVFSIHGNHDDPTGFGRLSSLDLLSTTGLVNYFGRWTDLNKLEINPILLRKGKTKLALYGLSHIHDGRLVRLFENSNVTINCPAESEEEWFHLMLLHQNRADRGPKNYLPEELLPSFLNLVIWGHEHDCRIEPEHNIKRDFYVSQPGSSVHTSLSEGESLKKHVALLEIYKNKFQLKPIPLETVRPFLFESVNLSDHDDELNLSDCNASNNVQIFAKARIEELIERAKKLLTGHPNQPKLPLIRLRLGFQNESHMFNTIRFGQLYGNRVANPAEIVVFKKLITKKTHAGAGDANFDINSTQNFPEELNIDNTARVEELVDRYFDEVRCKKPLKLLSSKTLGEMTHHLVERRDATAAENIIQFFKKRAQTHLMETLPNDKNIENQLIELIQNLKQDDIQKMLENLDKKNISESSNLFNNTKITKPSLSTGNPSKLSTLPTNPSVVGRKRPVRGRSVLSKER